MTVQQYVENGSKFCRETIKIKGRVLTSLTRRDPDVDTIWTIEHLLKNVDDLKAYLQLPDDFFSVDADVSNLIEAEVEVGDRGIVMVDIFDPLGRAASLFDMEAYTIIAFTEQVLFHRLLEKISPPLYRFAEQTALQFPGRMWRIYGPEYAAEPYLSPKLFEEYVVRYTKPILDSVHSTGGFARIHCHGRLKNILPHIVAMGADGLDPIEPPHQGDMELCDVRRDYGKDMVLFGNLEAADIENTDPSEFERVVVKALSEGTSGEGRGFVLQPSASPYGRKISRKAMANYETIARVASGCGA